MRPPAGPRPGLRSPRLIVIAKAPIPGRAKTRLTPPCSPVQAAALAEAALVDTLAAAGAAELSTVLALDGPPGPWLPSGVARLAVVAQRGGGLDERLAAAFDDAGGPALLVGMDTPQLSPELLVACMARLMVPGTDAVFGPAADGGWWAIGLRRPDPRVFLGVPMSTEATGQAQRARLDRLGLAVGDLPILRDVDVWADALAVPVAATSQFGAVVGAVTQAIARTAAGGVADRDGEPALAGAAPA